MVTSEAKECQKLHLTWILTDRLLYIAFQPKCRKWFLFQDHLDKQVRCLIDKGNMDFPLGSVDTAEGNQTGLALETLYHRQLPAGHRASWGNSLGVNCRPGRGWGGVSSISHIPAPPSFLTGEGSTALISDRCLRLTRDVCDCKNLELGLGLRQIGWVEANKNLPCLFHYI